jgi:hydrogenase/urease accessory protein HupE
MLDAAADSFDIPRLEATGSRPAPESFAEFLLLGIEHILTGYDHLLFLLGLLLPGCNLRTAAKIITSFTLAHSITLTLATLNLVWLPSRVVEPMIAMSIAYVGLENILRRVPSRRWLLTFGFGLVHGFGFASALRDLGIGAGVGGVVVPLFSFNLGVELGQMTLAGLALPVIMSLRHYPVFDRRAVPACSVLVALAGGYWFVQRAILS